MNTRLWTAYFWLCIFPGAHRLYLKKPFWWLLPLLFAITVGLSLTDYVMIPLVTFIAVLMHDVVFMPRLVDK